MIIIYIRYIFRKKEGSYMSKEAMIIAILIALVILWFTETIGMRKTSRILAGAIDLGFAVLR